ncbi:MAG: hypothetical protein OHK003_18770 [Anaerolineales bacterium]
MYGAGKKILRKVLRYACDARAFDSIFGGEQTIAGRDKMDVEIAIDQPAQVVENMGTRPLWAGYDIKGSVENFRHY